MNSQMSEQSFYIFNSTKADDLIAKEKSISNHSLNRQIIFFFPLETQIIHRNEETVMKGEAVSCLRNSTGKYSW